MNILSVFKRGKMKAQEEGIFEEIKQCVFIVDYFHGLIEQNQEYGISVSTLPYDEVADNLLFMAYDEINKTKKRQLALQSFKRDRYNYDAILVYVDLIDNLKNRLNVKKIILQDATYYLSTLNLFDPENEGNFWGIIETRPFMRLKRSYLIDLMKNKNYIEASKQANECLYLSENDNLGIRYHYMKLLCLTKQYKQATITFEKFNENSPFMTIPASVAYFNINQEPKARQILNSLQKTNKHFMDIVFKHDLLDYDTKEKLKSVSRYTLNSFEEMFLAINQNEEIMFKDLSYFSWLNLNYNKLKVLKKVNINKVAQVFEKIYREGYEFCFDYQNYHFYRYYYITDKLELFDEPIKTIKKLSSFNENDLTNIINQYPHDEMMKHFIDSLTDDTIKKKLYKNDEIHPYIYQKINELGLRETFEDHLTKSFVYCAMVWCHYNRVNYY